MPSVKSLGDRLRRLQAGAGLHPGPANGSTAEGQGSCSPSPNLRTTPSSCRSSGIRRFLEIQPLKHGFVLEGHSTKDTWTRHDWCAGEALETIPAGPSDPRRAQGLRLFRMSNARMPSRHPPGHLTVKLADGAVLAALSGTGVREEPERPCQRSTRRVPLRSSGQRAGGMSWTSAQHRHVLRGSCR